MDEIFGNKMWQSVKLGFGVLFVVVGIALPFLLESSETAKLADLETKGVTATATITQMTMSVVQASRGSTVGTYMLVRGIGGSRKAAVGAALISRSSTRSAARAAAATAYYDIEFEIPTTDGQYFLGSDHLLVQRTDKLDVGSQITVLHDPVDPSVHRLTSYSKPTNHVPIAVKAGVVMVALTLGALLILWGWPQSEDANAATAAPVNREIPQGRVTRVAAAPARAGAAAAPVRRAGFGPGSTVPKGFGPRART